MVFQKGSFVISLDFELFWGVRDRQTEAQYERYARGMSQALLDLLSLFSEFDIHATWAVVGFLFFPNKQELLRSLPQTLPEYDNEALNPYRYIYDSGCLSTSCHFAPELISVIRAHKGQEIGTHTFSHYYCLEKGQDSESFKADISSAVHASAKCGVQVKSLVPPRNQWNPQYLPVLHECGIKCYRGNEKTRVHEAARHGDNQVAFRRAVRLLDSFFNLTGYHTYDYREIASEIPVNIPSSRYLRPYSAIPSFLERLRLRRITRAMDDAAINNRIFHLWWHPHEFAVNRDENINFLRSVLAHFQSLRKRYGMESLSMGELSDLLAHTESDRYRSVSMQGPTPMDHPTEVNNAPF